MARIETDPNYTTPTFSRATAPTDLFKKEDVQQVSAALSTHDHSPGKGLKVIGTSLTTPLTLTMSGSQSVIGSGILNLVDTSGNSSLVFQSGAGNNRTKTIRVESINGSLEVVNSANTTVIMSVTDGGNLAITGSGQFGGAVTISGILTALAQVNLTAGNLHVVSNSDGVSGSIYLGDTIISRWSPGQLRIYSGNNAGLTVGGPVYIESDYNLYFSVNGYGFKGISGQPVVECTASLQIDGSSAYFNTARSARLYWDGSYLHTPNPLYADGAVFGVGVFSTTASGNVYSQGGIYYAGASNQSSLSIWNPGEWRVTSSPGNFYTAGVVAADGVYVACNGGPCQGKGAYVNTASSETVKTNIIPLDPADSLARVLDQRMTPVKYDYIWGPTPTPMNVPTEQFAPGEPPVPTVNWTPDWLGFIAEDVAKVVPEAVGMLDDGVTSHGLTMESLVPVLWGAVRALDARLKALEAA